jgi:hypothetical protein
LNCSRDSEQSGKRKQEAQATDSEVAQPLAPSPQQSPNADVDTGRTRSNPDPQAILVRLVNGDDLPLKPFEEQTLAIARDALTVSRRTYWVAIFAFLAGLAAAVFVGVQVFEMTKQTQILASQSEGASAGALLDEMNTRKQLDVAQKQMQALQDQVGVIRHNFTKEQQPFIWLSSEHSVLKWDADKNASWTYHYTNYGKSPARYEADRVLEVGPDALTKIAMHQMPTLPSSKITGQLPAGKGDFFTAVAPVSKETFDEAMKHDNWIVIAGTFIYYDSVGNRYTTDFCGSHLASNAIASCNYKHKINKKNPN